MKKVLLVQLSLQPPGGANGVAVWILEALKQDYSVSVLCWTQVDVALINRFYGTSLSRSEFNIYPMNRVTRWLLDSVPLPLDFLKTSLLLRHCKELQDDYDVIITANNEADFGCAGIQYINFPRGCRPPSKLDLPGYLCPFFPSGWIAGYRRFCQWLSGFSLARMKQNLTLVSSDWTGSKVRECYGIPTTTLYPPIADDFPEISWQDRENGFVCIGRITPEKELEKIIDIIGKVRSQGWDVHLHIVGTPDHARYYQRIGDRVRQNSSWIFLEENISRTELLRLISTHRYGIHGMTEEHFGMAVAELVSGGCLAFVPNGGGQVEIVAGNERLMYRTAEQAAASILNVMRDPELQKQLQDVLQSNAQRFSIREFKRRLRELVDGFRKN